MRRILLVSILILLILLVSAVYSANIVRIVGPTLFSNATFLVPCDRNTIALTIDDGPDPKSTPLILDVLKDHGVTATFFVIGKRGDKELLERITQEGHELANHTYNDKVTIALNEIALKKSIKNTHTILSEFQTILWFRPGAAFYNSNIVKEIKSYDYKMVIGDVWPFDTIITSSQFHSWYIKRSVQPGSIIIMHDARGKGVATATSLAMVLPQLDSMGYRVTSVGELKSGCVKKPKNVSLEAGMYTGA